MLLDQLRCVDNDVISSDVADQTEILESGDGILGTDPGVLGNVFDARLRGEFLESLQDRPGPVGAIADSSQIAEGFLRAPDSPLESSEGVAELDEEASVASPLVLREGEDAGKVIAFRAVLLLAEVAHDMVTVFIDLREDVEEEGFHVVVQSLVIDEELRQKTQALTVDGLSAAVHLEHSDVAFAIDFVSGRMPHSAFLFVFHHGLRFPHVAKTKFTNITAHARERERERTIETDIVRKEKERSGA